MSVLIILALVEAERQGRLNAPAWLVHLGSASYAIFLIHLIMLGLCLTIFHQTGLLAVLPRDAAFALMVAAGIGGGIAFFHLVERRLTRWPVPSFLMAAPGRTPSATSCTDRT